MRILPLLAAGAIASGVLIAHPQDASADQVKYVGVHPMPKGGVCHIEAQHVHVYQPHKSKKKRKLLYRTYDDHYHFVGDPTGHKGYDGPKVAYYGHHPIAVDVVAHAHVEGAPHHVEFCYLDGPHHHHYGPAADLEFTVKGDAHWYIGTYPPEYKKHRKALVRVNAIYAPLEYERPVVTVEPPAEYHGPVVGVVGIHGHAHVTGPAVRADVEVHVPTPSLEVQVGIPGVVVIDDHHHHHKHRKHKYRKHKKYKRVKYKRGKHKRRRHKKRHR